jgi:hypothetical protein
LFLGSLLESLAWLTLACYDLASSALVWAYIPLRVACSPAIRVHARPPLDVLLLLLSLATAAAVDGAGRTYETYVQARAWVPSTAMARWLADMGVICGLVWVVVVSPLQLPSERVDAQKIVSKPETRFSWMIRLIWFQQMSRAVR